MMEGLSSSELKLRGAAFGGTGGAKLATGPVPKAPSLKLVSGPCSLVRQVSGLKQITKVRFVADFCLRPSAKDQGITRVVLVAAVLVLVHHLVHFLIKRNLSEKNSPHLQITSLALYQLSYRDIVIKVVENYLFKDFKNHAADLGPVLVDTCFLENLTL